MIEREYYRDGQLRREVPYHQGQVHGIVKWWYHSGQLWYEHSYYEGQIHGVVKGWRCDGEIIYERYYLYNNEVTEEEYRRHELIVKLSGL